MRCARLLATILIGAVASPAAAQDAENLVAKNLEARGGSAAIDAIRNITFQGRTIFPGDFEVTYKEVRSRLGASTGDRVEYGIQGLNIVQGYDGSIAWKVNPLQGRKDAERMSADEARQLADSALIDGPLLASRHDGSRVTYLGRDDFDGTLAYKLKVHQKDGDEFTYWLDPDTYLEIKVEETRRIRGAEQTGEAELGDYERVAGVYFPMSVETWAQGHDKQRARTSIDTGTVNGEVPASLFAEPAAPTAPAKSSAAAPPDQGKPKGKPTGDKPSEQTTPPSSGGKGE